MSFFSLIKLCRIVEEMGENIINSRTISTKLNRIFSCLVIYQGMMTFVLMLKEPGPGLCFSQTQRAPTPFVAQQPMPAGLQLGGTHVPQASVRLWVFLPVQTLLTRF